LIFKVGNDFYQLNQLEKEFKRRTVSGRILAQGLATPAWPSGQSCPAAPGLVTARSEAGHRTLGDRSGTGILGSLTD
jgi:hypothetical protein